ncbi:MAG: AbrB family transcriptional regulator [Desulfuromonadales bacterium]
MEKYVVLILFGIVGGVLAQRFNVPGGAIVGSMVVSACVALCYTGNFVLPANATLAIQIVLGISLGMGFDRSLLAVAGKALPLAILSTCVLLLAAIGMAFIAHRLGLVDFATALFGFSPGGMSGMSILAQSEGHKTPIVALFHLVRIFTLFVIVPYLGRYFLLLVKKL